jgi:hypothetical protein
MSCPDRYEAEAAEFFRRNPHVYESFKMLAYKAVNAGKLRCSQRLLWERLRWELYISSDADVADYALNNNYVRWAAKRLEAEGELPGGFFQFRTRRGQGVDSPDLPE